MMVPLSDGADQVLFETTLRAGALRAGALRAGTCLAIVRFTADFVAGACLAGARLTGAFLAVARLAGAFLAAGALAVDARKFRDGSCRAENADHLCP